MEEIKAINVLDGAPITPDMIADFLDVGTMEAPDVQLLRVFEQVSENPNMKTITKHYTANKAATEIPIGFQTEIAIKGDMYKNEKVMDWLRDIAEEQKLGTRANFYSVRLHQQITGKDGVCYARNFIVSPVITGINKTGGEIISVDGSLKPQGDVVVGEFDLKTKKFTPAAQVTPVPDEPTI